MRECLELFIKRKNSRAGAVKESETQHKGKTETKEQGKSKFDENAIQLIENLGPPSSPEVKLVHIVKFNNMTLMELWGIGGKQHGTCMLSNGRLGSLLQKPVGEGKDYRQNWNAGTPRLKGSMPGTAGSQTPPALVGNGTEDLVGGNFIF